MFNVGDFVIYGKKAGRIDDSDLEDKTVRVSFNETDFEWVDISELKEK